jgi:enterochelin esterase-like enzyme
MWAARFFPESFGKVISHCGSFTDLQACRVWSLVAPALQKQSCRSSASESGMKWMSGCIK